MSRKTEAPSVRIINHKKYILEKRNLLCEFHACDSNLWIDIFSKTVRLYYPQGKEFVLETTEDISGYKIETKIISEKEARSFLDAHPECINEKVYVRFFGEPEKL